MRDFCAAQDWKIAGEYIDHAPANDQAHRTAWRLLLDDAGKRRFSVVFVFKLDRAFRKLDDHEVAAHIVEVLGVLGRKDEALEVLQSAESRHPDSGLLKDVRERLFPDSP